MDSEYFFMKQNLNLWCRVNGELQLRLLAEVDGEPFHEERGEAGAGAAAEGVEDEKALKAGALFSLFPDAFQNLVTNNVINPLRQYTPDVIQVMQQI